MPGPPPATAQVRLAVREALADLGAGALVAAAVSGGADSLALAAALAFERPGSCALVVDHGLQAGSGDVADRAAAQCRQLGLTAEVLHGAPSSAAAPGGGGGGPEAAARDLRYAALDRAADRLGLGAVLLGHTLDDQAETVLLGLARGSGGRALAGMAAVRGRYRRPLLGTGRATVHAACTEAGLPPWADPHNADAAYARVRVRGVVLPTLERELGPGVAEALARTAGQLREDADALDELARRALGALEQDGALDCVRLALELPAVRGRVLRTWAQQRSGGSLGATHVLALRALVERWHGQGPVDLPGGTRVERRGGRLAFRCD